MGAKDDIGEFQPSDSLRHDALKNAIPAPSGGDADVDGARESVHAILDLETIKDSFASRREASQVAGSAQSRFRLFSAVATIAAAVATLASGLVLYGAGEAAEAAAAVGATDPNATADTLTAAEQLAQLARDNRSVILWIQIAGTFAATVMTSLLAQQGHLASWNDYRRKAEDLRQIIFNDMLNAGAGKSTTQGPSNVLSYLLELFRRFQLDLQIDYYDKRAAQQKRSANLWIYVTVALSAAATVTGLVAQQGDSWLPVAALCGLAIPVTLSAAQSWRALNMFGDKAKSYDKAKDALRELRRKLDTVREDAANGDDAKVREFVDEVHKVMSNENTNWVAAAQ